MSANPGRIDLTGDSPSTVADGANVSLGATTDVAATTDTGTFSLLALFKRLVAKFPAALVGGRLDVNLGATGVTQPVGGQAAAGTAISGSPVLVGVSDGTNARFLLGDTSGRTVVSGAAAEGAALAGVPVLVAFRDVNNTTVKSPMVLVDNSDIGSVGSSALLCIAEQYAYDGASARNRVRNNVDGIIQASTATTTQTINTDIVTYNAGKIFFHFNVTSYNGGTFTAKLQWKDANGLFWDIPGATTGAKTSGADLVLALGAGTWPANTTTEFYVNFPLPRQVRLVETIATATITFSAAYTLNCN